MRRKVVLPFYEKNKKNREEMIELANKEENF